MTLLGIPKRDANSVHMAILDEAGNPLAENMLARINSVLPAPGPPARVASGAGTLYSCNEWLDPRRFRLPRSLLSGE